ncbi:MAG: hypothetical protein LIP18_06955 [Planctomycetes bacterium]|nr:hypothetical protein [Planctomycetota bacterium]
MPYLSITTGVALSPEQREAISREMAQLITVIPGKSVSNLMIGFHDKVPMVAAGQEGAQILFMDLKLYGTAEADQKKKFIEGSYEIFQRILGIPAERAYIALAEYPVFGARGMALGV